VRSPLQQPPCSSAVPRLRDAAAAGSGRLCRTPQRLRMAAKGEGADDGLPPLPGVDSVEFYNDVLGDTESTSARTLGRVEEIGIFPLGMVLNPCAVIPLHIFEMRYRQLFSQAWESDTKIGIVMFDKDKNLWSRVGTICKVIEFQTQPDGRIVTVNEGEQRFRVLKLTRSGSQMEYAKALVEFHDDVDSDEDLTELEDKVCCPATWASTAAAVDAFAAQIVLVNAHLIRRGMHRFCACPRDNRARWQVWGGLQQVLALSNELYGKQLQLKSRIKARIHAPVLSFAHPAAPLPPSCALARETSGPGNSQDRPPATRPRGGGKI
jgi:hypothetical protein